MTVKFYFIVLITVLLTGNATYALDQLDPGDYIIQYPQGFQYSALTGAGYSLHFHQTSANVGAGNPAAITGLEGWKTGITYQYSTPVKSLPVLNDEKLTLSQYSHWIPHSLGMTFQWNKIHMGIGYQQYYGVHSEMKFPNTVIYNIDEVMTPIDTATVTSVKKFAISEFSFSGAFQLQNIVFDGDELDLGASVILPRIDMFKQLKPYSLKISDTGYGMRLTAGFVYSVDGNLKVGFFYEPGNIIQHSHKVNPDPTVRESAQWNTEYPDQIHFGLSLTPSTKIGLNGNVSYISGNKLYWGKHFEYSGAIQYHYISELSFSIGAFTNHWKTDVSENNYLATDRPNQAMFLTLGARYQMHPFSLDFAIVDSHISEQKFRRQTIVKLEIGYSFQGD